MMYWNSEDHVPKLGYRLFLDPLDGAHGAVPDGELGRAKNQNSMASTARRSSLSNICPLGFGNYRFNHIFGNVRVDTNIHMAIC
jgi:hypothetical protein